MSDLPLLSPYTAFKCQLTRKKEILFWLMVPLDLFRRKDMLENGQNSGRQFFLSV